MELTHLEALNSCGKDLRDLPNDIQNAIKVLNENIAKHEQNPTETLEEAIEKKSADIAHAIYDYSEMDLPEEPEESPEAPPVEPEPTIIADEPIIQEVIVPPVTPQDQPNDPTPPAPVVNEAPQDQSAQSDKVDEENKPQDTIISDTAKGQSSNADQNKELEKAKQENKTQKKSGYAIFEMFGLNW